MKNDRYTVASTTPGVWDVLRDYAEVVYRCDSDIKALQIAAVCEAEFEAGQKDAQKEMREAMGIE